MSGRQLKIARYGFFLLGAGYVGGGIAAGNWVGIIIGIGAIVISLSEPEYVVQELHLFGWRIPPLALLAVASAPLLIGVGVLIARAA